MMGGRERFQRSAGTRTPWDVARAPFRPPSDRAASADREALRRGEGRTVSCFLRGSAAPYPRHLRPGTLVLTHGEMGWRPQWSFRRRLIPLRECVQSVEVRRPGRAEWNLKKGGTAFGVIPVPEFKVIVCQTDRGALKLCVPATDVALVRAALAC